MPFNDLITALFTDPVMSKPAVYQPQDGSDSFTLRVAVKLPDTITGFGISRIHTPTSLFDVPAMDVPQPMIGDQLTVDGMTYVVQSEPTADIERIIWTLNCIPQ